MKTPSKVEIVAAVLCFGLFVFLSLNWHSHSPKFTYHSEIWADRAGYHSYLPAAFDYAFDPAKFPKGIDSRTGNGFYLDSIPGKVITKYTCGEAILRIPFFLIGKLLRPTNDVNGAGFTGIDHCMIDVAASFYCVLGLFLLQTVLKRRWGGRTSWKAVLAILTGTNLLFYVIGDSGMTHAYSFFLFAAFIFLNERIVMLGRSFSKNFFLGVVAGLIVLTRPTNVVFLPVGILLATGSWSDAYMRIRTMLDPRSIFAMGTGSLIMLLPQIAYWNYAFGSPMVWSYGQERFTRLADPPLTPFWFAPYNGLFLYAPLLILILIGSAARFRSSPVTTTLGWSIFLVVSYVSASWFAWTYGCGFGSRNFVEYGVVFAFPLAGILGSGHRYRWLTGAAVLACCLYTLKLTFSSPNCWFGDVWDWHMFASLLFGSIS